MKYVTVQLHHVNKTYEYSTNLDLEAGKCYKIVTNGKYIPMRVKVLSISDFKNYDGYGLATILSAIETEAF